MKLSFTPDELAWIHTRTIEVGQAAVKVRDQKLVNLAAKVAYKTTPNALHVYLNRAERSLVLRMADFRLSVLERDVMNPAEGHEYRLIAELGAKLLPKEVVNDAS